MAGEAWLEGLSEEWDSLPPQSASNTLATQPNISRRVSFAPTESRIPHLAHSIRQHSLNGSYLRPRSQKGRQKEALREVSASQLNAIPSSPPYPPHSRKPSSNFNESQGSVQHHTIAKGSQSDQDTPEWKRRLHNGEDVTSDGFDLFSPSKLEGIFKQSTGTSQLDPSEAPQADPADRRLSSTQPWSSLQGSFAFPTLVNNPYRSYRTQRGGKPDMEAVQEEEEHEGDTPALENGGDLSALSPDLAREGSIRGLVRRQVSTFEQRKLSIQRTDDRCRTFSGRQELENEVISPVTVSTQNTIRTQALQASLDSSPQRLRIGLEDIAKKDGSRRRSRSLSGDRSTSRYTQTTEKEALLHEEPLEDMTSQSLPEDLSMGTQNYVSSTGHNSIVRGTEQGENSSFRKNTNSAPDSSWLGMQKTMPSSPPGHFPIIDTEEESELDLRNGSSSENSILHRPSDIAQAKPSAGPWELFGKKDTLTNNRISRVLHKLDVLSDSVVESAGHAGVADGPLRMSNFGQGELDHFDFLQEVEHPQLLQNTDSLPEPRPEVSVHKPQTVGQTKPSERSPKRRRTLVRDEVVVDGIELEVKLSHLPDSVLAGRKRTDAIPGSDPEQASPETLASRQLLRPSGSRKSSGSHSRTQSMTGTDNTVVPASTAPLAQALATELEKFTKSAAAAEVDSRKTSLNTKDYMQEANKVMELIRARGRPKLPVPDIEVPDDKSGLDPDQILEVDVDDTTRDSFSRPPSRERSSLPVTNATRVAQHDARMASHLRKFKDDDDLDLLLSTSLVENENHVHDAAVEEPAAVPLPILCPDQSGSNINQEEATACDDERQIESSPPGMRILNENDKKRKHSTGEDRYDTMHSGSDGTRRTIQTASSASSRGMITHGTVSIPDTVGAMTFDKSKGTWVKHKEPSVSLLRPITATSPNTSRNPIPPSEADPFDDIPDLSIDEQEEETRKRLPSAKIKGFDNELLELEMVHAAEQEMVVNQTRSGSIPAKSSLKSSRQRNDDRQGLRHLEAVRHEARLYQGLPSVDDRTDLKSQQQPRVVTIAFTSPIASEIPFHEPPSLSDLDEDDPVMLPIDEDGSVYDSSPIRPAETMHIDTTPAPKKNSYFGSIERHRQYRAMTSNRRTVSRIQEYEEDETALDAQQDMSLIHVDQCQELIARPRDESSILRTANGKQSSILCLTPLSDFTLHQADRVNHPEDSYVAERTNPKALRQAHGSQALHEDALVQAITDAEPAELYWEKLRKLELNDARLSSLRGLSDYCPQLDHLSIKQNRLAHLTDVPSSLRSLNVAINSLDQMTMWTHLRNLQIIDVSNNKLSTLECFKDLVHLRKLRASNNFISNINDILASDSLITLDVSHNAIKIVDFTENDLSSLEKLDISHNQLTHVDGLYALPCLQRLDASSNRLVECNVTVSPKISSIEWLDLSANCLSYFDLNCCPELQSLYLDDNCITRIDGLGGARMEMLSIRGQRQESSLAHDLLTSSYDISALQLTANSFVNSNLDLPRKPNHTLRTLDIAACGLLDLPAEFGESFPNLRELNLDYNAINNLEPVRTLSRLRLLSVVQNRISRMRRTCLTLARLPELKDVCLRNNPLTIGFYSPGDLSHNSTDIPLIEYSNAQPQYPDNKWIALMDEPTRLRRQAMYMLLAQCCPQLEYIDGQPFCTSDVISQQKTLQALAGKGVLQHSPSRAIAEANESRKRSDDISQSVLVTPGRIKEV